MSEQRNKETKGQRDTTYTIFRFRKFPVYQDTREFRRNLKQLSKLRFPREEHVSLRMQLWRALDSVLLNIAEGTDRHSDKDFSHFLNISLGSLNEVIACLDCALDDGYVPEREHQEYLMGADRLVRQLKALLAKVRKDDRSF